MTVSWLCCQLRSLYMYMYMYYFSSANVLITESWAAVVATPILKMCLLMVEANLFAVALLLVQCMSEVHLIRIEIDPLK